MLANRAFPSMTALRVAVGIAEHGSTTACGQALHLTQSAVSKQLLALEALVGIALFNRTARGLLPTEAGRIYVTQARIALGAIEAASLRLAALQASPCTLRVHVLPILGDRWLVPRLAGFSERHPDIEIELATLAANETVDEADAAFRFGEGDWPGQQAEYLFGRQIALVGSPQLLARMGGFESPAEARRYPLLDHKHTPLRWGEFAEAQKLTDFGPERITHFGFYALVIRAAIAGQGLALVPRGLILDELVSGRLVNPLGLGFVSRHGYWLTYPLDRPKRPVMQAFRDWLTNEANALPGDAR
jgi:LysR family glycine cleavage system transcriptional activator